MDEFIFFPILRLKIQSQSLSRMARQSTMTDESLNSEPPPPSIRLFTESTTRSIDVCITRNATIIDVTYSILVCPNGCSRSAGFDAILKLTSEMMDEPASAKLLTASAVIAIESAINLPTVNLLANRIILMMIATTLTTVPYRRLTSGEFIFICKDKND